MFQIRFREVLLLCLFGAIQVYMISFAEFIPDETQTILALEQITTQHHFPVFWIGAYPFLPHGLATIYIYAPFYKVWHTLLTPYYVNVLLNILTSAALITAGRILGFSAAGLLAATLFMLHPTFSGFYSLSIWNMTSIIFLTMYCLLFLLTYLDSKKQRFAIISAVFLSLLPYAHILSFLMIPIFFFALWPAPRKTILCAFAIILITDWPFAWYLLTDGKVSVQTILIVSLVLCLGFILILVPLSRNTIKVTRYTIVLLLGASFLWLSLNNSNLAIRSVYETLDTIHSYNLYPAPSLFINIRGYLPHLERIVWFCFLLYSLCLFHRWDTKRQALFLFAIFPTLLLDILFTFFPHGFAPTHHRSIFVYPAQFLFLSVGYFHLFKNSFIRKTVVTIQLLFLITSLFLFSSYVSRDGRPTFNEAMLHERREVATFINNQSDIASVSLLTPGTTRIDQRLPWMFFLREFIKKPLTQSTIGVYYYISIRGTREWNQDIEQATASKSELVYENGRIKIFRSSSDLSQGVQIFPMQNECLHDLQFWHDVPVIALPRC